MGLLNINWDKKAPLEEVFGVSNKKILSYIQRKTVDMKFIEALNTRKHIIVFGSSKQGKTSLTNECLVEKDFVRINCSPDTTRIDIYKSILRQLNLSFDEERSEKIISEGTAKTVIKAKVKIPLITSFNGELGGSGKIGKEKETKYKNIDYNLSLPQDISEILNQIEFNRRIIIENFHYLDENVQKQLSFDLRVFEDSNILFIILGIWREKNRLAQFNGDLQDRVIEIPVEPWDSNDFKIVAQFGENLLNISISNIVDEIIANSFGNIGIFQELCKEACIAAGIMHEQIYESSTKKTISLEKKHLDIAIKKKLADYNGRHIRSIEAFAEQRSKKSKETPLFIAFYFLKYLFSIDFKLIQNGIKRSIIHEGIKNIHHRPDDVRASDISYFLHNIVSSQLKKNIIPPIFDYDRSTSKLKVIDSTLYYFFRHADIQELFTVIDDPLSAP